MGGKWRWNAAQFAERNWWRNYLKNKEVAPYLEWKKNYWKDLLDHCKPYFDIQAGDLILDAGCGPAGMFMLFEGSRTVAFDPLITTYERDLPHFKSAMYPDVTFVEAGLENFRSEKKFDVLFCMNAINHVQDIEASYDQLLALAAPKAHVVVTVDAHNHAFFKHLFRLLPGDILHPHQYDLEEYKNFMKQRGCNVIATIHLKHEFFFDHYMLIGQMS